MLANPTESFHHTPAAPNTAHPSQGQTWEKPFPMAPVQYGTRTKGDVTAGARNQLCRFQPCPCVGLGCGNKGRLSLRSPPAPGLPWRIPWMLLWAATNAQGERGSQQSPPLESTSFTPRLEGGERKGRARV